MKKRSIKVLVLAVTLIGCMLLGSCGMETTYDVDVANKSIKAVSSTYFTEEELQALAEQSDEPLDMSQLEQVERDGVTYYVSTEEETIKGLNKLRNASMVLDSNKFICYSNILDNSGMEDMGELQETFEFYNINYNFNKPILTTNLKKVSENSVQTGMTDTPKEVMYVTFTKKAANCKSVKSNISKKYTRTKKVKFTSDGVITGYTVNGKKYSPTVYSETDGKGKVTLHKDYYKFKKNGKYAIKVKLSSGYTRTFNYVYDTIKPTANVKAGYKYKAGKKLTVKDKYGISKITLDGKKVKNGVKMTKKGTRTLKVYDKAGNVRTVKFKIVK